MKNIRITLWATVLLALVAVAVFWTVNRNQEPIASISNSVTDSFPADFELTDQNGVVQSNETFRGRWLLVFFGFTNCPDVCPMGLATIAQVMDDLGKDGGAIQPLFITIDPERDTQAVLSNYIPQFGPRILGLSGSPEQIERTAQNFKIYYQKIEEGAAPDGYTMGHTSSFLLFDREGEFVRVFDYDSDPAQIVADLQDRIGT